MKITKKINMDFTENIASETDENTEIADAEDTESVPAFKIQLVGASIAHFNDIVEKKNK